MPKTFSAEAQHLQYLQTFAAIMAQFRATWAAAQGLGAQLADLRAALDADEFATDEQRKEVDALLSQITGAFKAAGLEDATSALAVPVMRSG